MDIASIETSLHPVFVFILLTLASFRLTRVLVEDSWPPSQFVRDWVDDRFGPTSAWSDFIRCPWCAGTYITAALFALAAQLLVVPLPVLQAVAAMSLVGYLGTWDTRN